MNTRHDLAGDEHLFTCDDTLVDCSPNTLADADLTLIIACCVDQAIAVFQRVINGVLRFATIPKGLLSTGKPQFGHGKLSIFVPHLGQIMVTASVYSYLLNDLFLVLLCKVAELIAPDAFVYHDRLDKTILYQRR